MWRKQMRREWVKGPRGEYLLVAGTPRFRDMLLSFQASGNDLMSAADPFGVSAAWSQHLARYGTNRGYVAVYAYGRRWQWVLPRGVDPAAAGETVARLIESGEWVPETMPLPALPDGASPYGARPRGGRSRRG
jgi:hypothetical protein